MRGGYLRVGPLGGSESEKQVEGATKVDSVEFWCGCRCQVFATGSCGCVGAEERSCPGARLFKVVKIWGVRVRNPRGEVIE